MGAANIKKGDEKEEVTITLGQIAQM